MIRLRDGETILVGGAPDYERALVLAQKTITGFGEVKDGEWPMLGDRFVNPDAIVSVDVSLPVAGLGLRSSRKTAVQAPCAAPTGA